MEKGLEVYCFRKDGALYLTMKRTVNFLQYTAIKDGAPCIVPQNYIFYCCKSLEFFIFRKKEELRIFQIEIQELMSF